MTRRVWVAGFALAFGLGAVSLADVRADDEKKPEEKSEKEKPETPPTPATIGSGPTARFTGYVHVADVHGEVVTASDSSLTVRIYYLAPKTTNNRNRGGGGRPSIGSNGMIHPSHRRNPGVKWVHHDYHFDYHPDGLARVQKLPPKIDADGKRVDYTNKEFESMREPSGFPGYNLAKTDLRPGDIVDVNLVRDRSIPQSKSTESDLKVKWAKVTGHVDHAPAPAKPAPKKKM
jgi:hypothetical protein